MAGGSTAAARSSPGEWIRWVGCFVTMILVWEMAEDLYAGAAPPRRDPVQLQVGPIARALGGGVTGVPGGWATATTAGAGAEVISSTGHLFGGERARTFVDPLVYKTLAASSGKSPVQDTGPTCEKWSVVTTIHPPSAAVLAAAALQTWCTVIVGDTKTPSNYLTPALRDNPRVVFIPHDATVDSPRGDAVGDYIRSVPFKHFARKNIGFLYAIRHGADHIFDFDDDNILDASPFPELLAATGAVINIEPRPTGAINVYPMLGASVTGSWPRGFPLQDINNLDTWGSINRSGHITGTPTDLANVGVWQSAANGDPDVDAVHRMTKATDKIALDRVSRMSHAFLSPVPSHAQRSTCGGVLTRLDAHADATLNMLIGACDPMGGCYGWLLWGDAAWGMLIGACDPMGGCYGWLLWVDATLNMLIGFQSNVVPVSRLQNNTQPYNFAPIGKSALVILPPGTYTPYNAQATVHSRPAMWATLLPMTVPGRVSDIWRGYFAQRIFEDLGLSVAYMPPRVHQDRNPHNYLADMQAEGALYFQTGKLLEFLHGWDGGGAASLPEMAERLWIALYERTYIELEDVVMMQRWLQALVASGYVFPTLKGNQADQPPSAVTNARAQGTR